MEHDNPSERADESLAREDFSKVSELDQSAQDNLYDGEERPAPQDLGPGPQLADWSHVKSGAASSFDGDEDGLETMLSGASTLKDHLEAQVAIAALTPDDRLIALALIDAIDEAGYVRAELGDIAERLGTDVEDVDAVLGVVQGFDPVGVGARDLAECLSLQLKAKDRLDPVMAKLLTRLDLLAKRDLPGLCRALRRGRRGHGRHDRGDPRPQSQAGPGVWRRTGGAGDPRRVRAGGTGRRLAGGVELRHPAQAPGQFALLREGEQDRARQGFARPISPIASTTPTGW